MTRAFDHEAAADCLIDLMFSDTRMLCRAGAAGWEGNDEQVFEDYEDFERYCVYEGNDPDMVEAVQLRDYLFDVVRFSGPEVLEKKLSRYLEAAEVSTVIAAGRSTGASP